MRPKKDRIRKGQFGVKMGEVVIQPKPHRKPKHKDDWKIELDEK